MPSLPQISSSDLRPIELTPPNSAPLNVGQIFIDAYQKTHQAAIQREALSLEQQKIDLAREEQAWNNQYLRPLKIQEAQLGLANAGAALATKSAQMDYYKAKAQNETAKAATQQAIYGTIDSMIQSLNEPDFPESQDSAKAATSTDPATNLDPTMPDGGAELLLPSPDGKPPGTWTPTTGSPQSPTTPALPSPEEYARGLTTDAKDQAHIVQIVNMAKAGDFDGLQKLSPVDQDFALRGAGMVDSQGKALPPEQWGKAPPASPNPIAPQQSPTVEGVPMAPVARQPSPVTNKEHPRITKVAALEQMAKALLPSDPKAQTAKLAVAIEKQSPRYKAALDYESGRKATLQAEDLIRFAKDGQLADFAASHPGVAFTLKTDKDGNAVDMVDPKTGQPLTPETRVKIANVMAAHALEYSKREQKPWMPPESLGQDYRNYAEAQVEFNSTQSLEEKIKAKAKMESAYLGMIAHATADPEAKEFLAKLAANSSRAAPLTTTAPDATTVNEQMQPNSQPSGISRDEAMRRADALLQQADAMEQSAFNAWDATAEDGGAAGEADYNEAVKKANALRQQAEAIKTQANSAITSIKQIK